MEHRAAAAATAGEPHVVFLHTAGITLFPRVLRPANHHRIGVTPQEQDALRGGHLAKNALFDREIKPRIVRV